MISCIDDCANFLTLVRILRACNCVLGCHPPGIAVAACTVRTGFYATECEGFRNRVFFFRKPVWTVVRKTTLQKLNQDMFQVRASHL
jgi:hypothetical protein